MLVSALLKEMSWVQTLAGRPPQAHTRAQEPVRTYSDGAKSIVQTVWQSSDKEDPRNSQHEGNDMKRDN